MKRFLLVVAVLSMLAPGSSTAETPEEWVTLGARVHGGFGAFIPVGIRIGEDALKRLNAKPREVAVTYYDSDKAPCACIADGIMLATTASPGQRSLTISAEKAPDNALAVIAIRNKASGAEVKYVVPLSLLPRLGEWNKTLGPIDRYEAVMKADGVFQVD